MSGPRASFFSCWSWTRLNSLLMVQDAGSTSFGQKVWLWGTEGPKSSERLLSQDIWNLSLQRKPQALTWAQSSCQRTYPSVCLVRRKSKQGSSMCICNSTYYPSAQLLLAEKPPFTPLKVFPMPLNSSLPYCLLPKMPMNMNKPLSVFIAGENTK